MTIGQWLLAISLLLLTTHLLRPWCERIMLSAGVVVVLCGIGFSLALGWLDIDTGLRWQGLSGLILQLLLPMMVFAGACRLDRSGLTRHKGLSLFLCLPGLLASVAICAAAIYLLLYWFEPVSLGTALLLGFILSASDPFCLSGYFHRYAVGASNLRVLEKESVFTDAIVVVGYTFLVAHHSHFGDDGEWLKMILFFAGNLLGELVVGLAAAAVVWKVIGATANQMHRQIFAVAMALLALGLCQSYLVTDGLLAAFLVGLACGDANKASPHDESLLLSELVEYLCAVLILALLGLSFTAGMFTDHWLAMLCACAAILIARAAVVAAAPRSLLGDVSRKWLFLGYSQCAVPAAIALSLPLEIDNWYLVQSMVYGVAVMTLLGRGPALEFSLRRKGRFG